MGRKRRGRKKPYPRNSDVSEAIMEVLAENPLLHSQDLVEAVKKKLEEKGFYAGLVNAKRVWRIYEQMVRKGIIYDVLMVMKDYEKLG